MKLNRLWIRISVVFTLVVLGIIMIPLTLALLTQSFQVNNNWQVGDSPKTFHGTVDPEVEEDVTTLSEVPGQAILGAVTRFLIFITVMGVIVGAISSRGLTAPLTRLADAAKAIGQRDLSQRVEVEGSLEIQEVANAFNEMAAHLERSEINRQNLLADIAHELRTPLTVIQGNLRAILDDVYELNTTEISRLYDQTRQLSRLVDDLRDLAQAEANSLPLEKQSLDVGQMVADIAKIHQPAAEAGIISLITEIDPNLPHIKGDPGRLTQSLQNLLNNALNHTPPGGTVNLSAIYNNERIKIIVKDTGAGIAPDNLPKVFDRLYRADPARSRDTGGSGLGLTITKAIIVSHGGEIFAVSEGLGKGSIFTIHLPIE